MTEYIKKEDAIEAVMSIFRVSALFSGTGDNEEKWREKAEKVLAKCEVLTGTADTPQTDCENCAHWEHGAGQHYCCALLEMGQECYFESKDESTLMFANVPQTDCGWGEPNE